MQPSFAQILASFRRAEEIQRERSANAELMRALDASRPQQPKHVRFALRLGRLLVAAGDRMIEHCQSQSKQPDLGA